MQACDVEATADDVEAAESIACGDDVEAAGGAEAIGGDDDEAVDVDKAIGGDLLMLLKLLVMMMLMMKLAVLVVDREMAQTELMMLVVLRMHIILKKWTPAFLNPLTPYSGLYACHTLCSKVGKLAW